MLSASVNKTTEVNQFFYIPGRDDKACGEDQRKLLHRRRLHVCVGMELVLNVEPIKLCALL